VNPFDGEKPWAGADLMLIEYRSGLIDEPAAEGTRWIEVPAFQPSLPRIAWMSFPSWLSDNWLSF